MQPDALVVIDVQTALVEAHPYREQEFLSNLAKLLKACRGNGVPVIYIQHCEPEGALRRESPGWEIAAAIAPKAGERRIEKWFSSAFRQTNLRETLEAMGAKRLVLCGMQTEYCVDTTVKVAFELGYDVTIPRGATSTFNQPMFQAADLLRYYEDRIWDERFAKVLPMDAVLSAIEG